MNGAFQYLRSGVAALMMTTLFMVASSSQGESAFKENSIPALLDLDKIKFDIVAVTFVKELDGAGARYRATQPDKYQAAVVTLRVAKAKGQPLRLHVPDFSLHYHRTNDYDVVGCTGISGFSTVLDQDRPMTFFAAGFGKTFTGLATTAAEQVYVDLFFGNIENDVTDVYLLVGQASGASFRTKGWRKD